MEEHEEKEAIKNLISKMNLTPNIEAALILHTTKIYNEFKQEKIMHRNDLYRRVAVSAFLACDGEACVSLPRLKRATGSCLSIKNIQGARTKLNIPRGSAHQKLDTLCKVCQVRDRDVIATAHDYLFSARDLRSPTSMATAALYAACRESGTSPRLTEHKLSMITGLTEQTIRSSFQFITGANEK